jgi:hypothetical protein
MPVIREEFSYSQEVVSDDAGIQYIRVSGQCYLYSEIIGLSKFNKNRMFI